MVGGLGRAAFGNLITGMAILLNYVTSAKPPHLPHFTLFLLFFFFDVKKEES